MFAYANISVWHRRMCNRAAGRRNNTYTRRTGKNMFTTEELKNIDCTYFHIISAGCYCVTLQSKNTNHYWHIIHQQYPSFATCKIQHKHRQSIPFHEQGTAPTLGQAIDKIKAHDFYHLHVRTKKKACKGTDQKGRKSA